MDETLFSDPLQLPEFFISGQCTHRHITVHEFGDDWRLRGTHYGNASATRLYVIHATLKVIEKRRASTQGGACMPQGLEHIGVDKVAGHLSKT